MDKQPVQGTGRAEVGRNERAQAAVSVEIFLRLISHARDCFPEDDLDTITIYLTVAVSSVSRHLRNPRLLVQYGADPFPHSLKQPTSARAVAASTGLPRETVRRKLKTLVASGRLVQEADGFFSPMDVLRLERNLDFARRLTAELVASERRIGRFEDLPHP